MWIRIAHGVSLKPRMHGTSRKMGKIFWGICCPAGTLSRESTGPLPPSLPPFRPHEGGAMSSPPLSVPPPSKESSFGRTCPPLYEPECTQRGNDILTCDGLHQLRRWRGRARKGPESALKTRLSTLDKSDSKRDFQEELSLGNAHFSTRRMCLRLRRRRGSSSMPDGRF